MYEAFYIVRVREDWYQLHIKDTHYCLGAGNSLEPLVGTVKRLVKKYRTKERLLRALNKLEDKGKVCDSVLPIYKEYYNTLSGHFDSLVKNTVKEALDEIKEDSTFNRVKKRLRTIKLKDTDTTEPPIPTVIEDYKCKAKRPKVLKRSKRLGI